MGGGWPQPAHLCAYHTQGALLLVCEQWKCGGKNLDIDLIYLFFFHLSFLLSKQKLSSTSNTRLSHLAFLCLCCVCLSLCVVCLLPGML